MTGLNPDQDHILEIATIITDSELNLVAEGPSLVVHQPDAVLDAMGPWCVEQHGASGLTQRVRESQISLAEAEQQTLAFIKQYVDEGVAPLCGNSISQDRRFLYRHMTELESYLNYRIIDVSSVKELAKRWSPVMAKGLVKKGAHLALDDIRESIEELRYYREHFFKIE